MPVGQELGAQQLAGDDQAHDVHDAKAHLRGAELGQGDVIVGLGARAVFLIQGPGRLVDQQPGALEAASTR